MAHLYKKVKKGHEYFYIRETQRIYGKPTTINQVYLGTADKVQVTLDKGGFSPKEFGSVFALNELDRSLDLAGVVNEILPPKKRTKGPTLGELVFYAALNRAVSPTSKRQLASWYETTDIQRIRPLRLESLNSQNFWNHWDRISDQDLEKISKAFFRKVHSLLPAEEKQLIIEAANISSTPRPSPYADFDAADQEGLPEPLSQQRIGLALLTERFSGIPLYYHTFQSGLPETGIYEYLQNFLTRTIDLGVAVKDITVLVDKDLASGGIVPRLDAQENSHFIASLAPDFAPEMTRISLKDFRPLPAKATERQTLVPQEDDKILYYETQAPFWNKSRRVIVTFDPKAFHRSYQDLGKKVQRVRKEMAARQQTELPGDAIEPLQAHLAQLCQRLKISPSLFQLAFHKEKNGQLRMDFQLDHRQMAGEVRHFGKNILITDREDWGAAEIYETWMNRNVLGMQEGSGTAFQGSRSGNAKEARSLFQAALMPLYHWTDSKIRVHLFVCVVALTYLTLLCHRLATAGMVMSPKAALEELRALRTAIYLKDPDGKLRRVIERINETQKAMLKALGYQVEDGKILPLAETLE
jgi:transposase